MPSRTPFGLLIRSCKGLAVLLGILLLAACRSDGPKAPLPTLSLTPATATVAVGGQVAFTALVTGCEIQPTWQVEEPSGGTVNAQGVYTAPQVAGVYHVRAVTACNPILTAVATVTVLAQPQAEAMIIEAPTSASQDSTQSAAVRGGSGEGTLRWSIQGGIFEGEAAHPATPSVAFRVTAKDQVTLDCERVDASGQVLARASRVTVPATPQVPAPLAIHAPAFVSSGTGTHTVQVNQPQAGWTYRWTIAGGTFQGGTSGEGAAVTFQAGPGPRVVLTCTATNASGAVQGTSTVSAAVLDQPRTPVIKAPASMAVGSTQVAQATGAGPGMVYRWTIEGGAFAGSDAEPSSDEVAFTASQAGQVALSCQVVNLAGAASGAATVLVDAQGGGQAPTLLLPAWVTAGTAGIKAQVSQPASGFRYEWSFTGATLEGSGEGAEVAFRAGGGPVIGVTCVATDLATGARATAQGAIAVASAPEMPVIHAPETILEDTVQFAWVQGGSGNSFRWEIQGGTFLENGPTSRVVSFRAGAPGTLIITCRGANDAGTLSDVAAREVTVMALAGEPSLEVAPWVAQGSAGNTARVLDPKTGETYDWSIQGGTLTSPARGTSVTFTAGEGPGLTLVCVANGAGGSVSSPTMAGVAVGPAAVKPVIQAAATASPGSYQVAWVQARPGERYQWTITGGTAVGPTDGPVLAYNAGQAGEVVLTCTASSGPLSQASTPVAQPIGVSPAPGSLVAPILDAPAWITVRGVGSARVEVPVQGATYTWTITGGQFGPTKPAQVTGHEVAFQADYSVSGHQIILLCTATFGTDSATSAVAVAVAPEPRRPEVVAPAIFTAGSGPVRADVVNPEPGMRYTWTIQGGTFLDGTGTANGPSVQVDGSQAVPLTLTCEAWNAANAPSPRAVVNLQGVPAGTRAIVNAPRYWTVGQPGLTATAAREDGSAATFLWQIQGGTFQGGATTAQGETVHLDASTVGTRILSCVAQDAFGSKAPATLAVVDIVAAPAIQAFRLVSDRHLYRDDSAMMVAQFTGGTGTVDNGVGPVASGQNFQVDKVSMAEAYTLTVRNVADATLSMTLRPQVQMAATTIEAFSAQELVNYGGMLDFTWRLQGTPTNLVISQTGDPETPGVTVLSPYASSYSAGAVRRQKWTLTSQDPLGTNSSAIETAARGVEVLAGNPGPSSNGFLDGPLATAAWKEVTGLAADQEGHVWFSEGEDSTIRRINPDGTVSVVAGLRGNPGDGSAPADPKIRTKRLYLPGGLAVGAGGLLRIADIESHTIKSLDMGGSMVIEAGEPLMPGTKDGAPVDLPTLTWPADIATHQGTDISFLIEPDIKQVRMLGPEGTVRTIHSGLAYAGGIAVDANGTVYVSDWDAGTIHRLVPSLPLTLNSTFTDQLLVQGLKEPQGLAIDPAPQGPRLLVAESGAHQIRALRLDTLSGTVLDQGMLENVAGRRDEPGSEDGVPGQAKFMRPTRLAVGKDRVLYVADKDSTTLRRISDGFLQVTTLGRPASHGLPVGSADGDGRTARFNAPRGVVEDSHGNLFVADQLNHTIRCIAPDGKVTTFAGKAGEAGDQDTEEGAPARFNQPTHLAIDSRDNLYVAEPGQNRIRRISPDGKVVTWLKDRMVFGPDQTEIRLSEPKGLAVGKEDALFFADTGSGQVFRVDAQRTQLPESVTGQIWPEELASDGNGKLYALSLDNQAIYTIENPGGGWETDAFVDLWDRGARDITAQDLLDGDRPQLNGPKGIACDGKGGLYVADSGNQLVRRIAADGTVTTVVGSYPYGDIQSGVLPGFLPYLTGITVTSRGDLVLTGESAVLLVTAP